MQYSPSDFGLVSVVIPLFNEAENIRPLIQAIDGAMQDYCCEILLINDGSTDGTATEIKQFDHQKIKLVDLQINHGQSLALAVGIEMAKGDYIVTLDGDLQNDPEDIPWMLNKAKAEQWDLVTGIRQHRKDPFLKTIPSKVANYIIRKVTNLKLIDQGCGLKIFTKKTAKKLHLYSQMHRYIPVLVHFNGGRIAQVPVRHNPRLFGTSKYGLERIFKVSYDLLFLIYRQRYCKKLEIIKNSSKSEVHEIIENKTYLWPTKRNSKPGQSEPQNHDKDNLVPRDSCNQ